MWNFFRRLFSPDFMPHGHCYFWDPTLVWLHAASDSLIALSYYVIPLTLLYFVRKRKDLPFNWMFVMFGIFIFGCGTTHVMEVWTLWNGTYRLAGVIKAITALSSIATAVMLLPLIPKALALPSPEELRRVNAALRASRNELERRVLERTEELANANAQLQAEIAEHRRASDALHEAQFELAHMSRVATMGELVASIAHEVNQPLTAVVMNGNACLRWMNASPPNLDEARLAASRIVKEGDRAGAIIQRIRSFLKKRPSQISRLDVNEMICEVLTLTRNESVKRNVHVRTELANDIPEIAGDRVQLQQVVLNLVVNAIEATSISTEGQRELLISSERRGTDQVVVVVRDSGIGIDPTHLDHIFDPFFTTKADGMGMGLSISRSMVQAHNGRLWATRNSDRGATFQFSLPAKGT